MRVFAGVKLDATKYRTARNESQIKTVLLRESLKIIMIHPKMILHSPIPPIPPIRSFQFLVQYFILSKTFYPFKVPQSHFLLIEIDRHSFKIWKHINFELHTALISSIFPPMPCFKLIQTFLKSITKIHYLRGEESRISWSGEGGEGGAKNRKIFMNSIEVFNCHHNLVLFSHIIVFVKNVHFKFRTSINRRW